MCVGFGDSFSFIGNPCYSLPYFIFYTFARKLFATCWGCEFALKAAAEPFLLYLELVWKLSLHVDMKAFTIHCGRSWQESFALHVEVAWELSLLVLLAGDPVEEAEHRILDWLVLLLTAGMPRLVQPERWGSKSTLTTRSAQSTQSARLSVQSSELGPPARCNQQESVALPFWVQGGDQGVIKRCRLSWLTSNRALVYEHKCEGGGVGLRGLSQWVQLCTLRPN